jgi:hypothetical protein
VVLLAPGIVVNGVKISPEQINFEVQYHPAVTLEDARYAAMKALVIRELLLQRAAEIGVSAGYPDLSSPNEDESDRSFFSKLSSIAFQNQVKKNVFVTIKITLRSLFPLLFLRSHIFFISRHRRIKICFLRHRRELRRLLNVFLFLRKASQK